jgi:hypothetical protein
VCHRILKAGCARRPRISWTQKDERVK